MSAFKELPPELFRQHGHRYYTTKEGLEASICPPPCDCTDCLHSFYSCEEQEEFMTAYHGRVSDKDASHIVAMHMQDIKKGRRHLIELLDSHGDMILNRWKKKSQAKRADLLREVAEGLYEQQWILPRYAYSLDAS